jgi:hypothetical protein
VQTLIDPVSLAALAAPIVIKGAEAFSNATGEKLGGMVGDLCHVVINKFKGDSAAEETLALAQKKPESKGLQSAVEEILAEKIKDDPDFAENVRKLVDEMQKERAGAVFDQRGQTVHGPQTNIAGDVKGQVFFGTFSGPVNIDKNEDTKE